MTFMKQGPAVPGRYRELVGIKSGRYIGGPSHYIYNYARRDRPYLVGIESWSVYWEVGIESGYCNIVKQ